MKLAEVIGLILLLVLVLAIVVIAVRRQLLARTGGFDVSWRDDLSDDGRGWSLGQGRYRGGDLALYRSFSPLPLAARTLHRSALVIGATRAPVGTEPDLLPVGAVIVRCTEASVGCELAMSEEALTGLRSWVEASPPGSRMMPGDPSTGLKQY
jgi:hypothetical protein